MGGVNTKYLIDDLNPTGFAQVVEEIVNGSVQRVTYGNSLISQNQLISGNWAPSFYGYDGHSSVRFLTDANGALTDRYDYDAFGNLIASTGVTPNKYLYSGEQFDADIGSYYLRARYYSQQRGRFFTMDSILGETDDPISLHRYLYANVDPVNISDPSGLVSVIEKSELEIKISLDPEIRGAIALAAYSAICVLFRAASELWPGIPIPFPYNLNPACQSGRSDCPDWQKEPTPTTDPDQFEPVTGTPAKRNKKTGEIWVKDNLHGDHWEVYKNKKDWEKNRRTRDVWDNGCPKRTF